MSTESPQAYVESKKVHVVETEFRVATGGWESLGEGGMREEPTVGATAQLHNLEVLVGYCQRTGLSKMSMVM